MRGETGNKQQVGQFVSDVNKLKRLKVEIFKIEAATTENLPMT